MELFGGSVVAGLVPATSRRYEGVSCPGMKAYPAVGMKACPAQVRMLQELPYQGLVAGTRPATTLQPLIPLERKRKSRKADD